MVLLWVILVVTMLASGGPSLAETDVPADNDPSLCSLFLSSVAQLVPQFDTGHPTKSFYSITLHTYSLSYSRKFLWEKIFTIFTDRLQFARIFPANNLLYYVNSPMLIHILRAKLHT